MPFRHKERGYSGLMFDKFNILTSRESKILNTQEMKILYNSLILPYLNYDTLPLFKKLNILKFTDLVFRATLS